MSGFFGAVWWLIVTLGVLVTFHEFGHYWVARRCGVKVLKFSVGFGRPLWSRVGANGTKFQVAMIPLGGYVQFLDEREAEVTPADRSQAFNQQPVLQRIAIVLAGPLANLLLCVLLFWATFMIGWPGIPAILGQPEGLAAEAGFREGDRIVGVGGDATATWNQAITPLALAAIDRQPVRVTVEDRQGRRSVKTLPLERLASKFDQTDPLQAMGLITLMAADPPIVGQLSVGFPAAGKLRTGDRIRRIGDQSISRFAQIPPALQLAAAKGAAVSVEFERDGQLLRETMQPRAADVDGRQVWQLGVAAQREVMLLRYGPLAALGISLR